MPVTGVGETSRGSQEEPPEHQESSAAVTCEVSGQNADTEQLSGVASYRTHHTPTPPLSETETEVAELHSDTEEACCGGLTSKEDATMAAAMEVAEGSLAASLVKAVSGEEAEVEVAAAEACNSAQTGGDFEEASEAKVLSASGGTEKANKAECIGEGEVDAAGSAWPNENVVGNIAGGLSEEQVWALRSSPPQPLMPH